MPRRRRFDEGVLGAITITAMGLAAGALLLVLGHALRAVDDQLVDFD